MELLVPNEPYSIHAKTSLALFLPRFDLKVSDWPTERFYYGYIWDGTGNRKTQPIRNPRNKSHMPVEQVC